MVPQQPTPLILASASHGRRYLLEKAGYQFTILPANIDEPTQAKFGSCRQYVQEIAWRKAAAVAEKFAKNTIENTVQNTAENISSGFILAADTVGWLNNQVIGKPEDENDARRILSLLSGQIHELWTGVCLWRCADHFQWQWQELSKVKMKSLTSSELDSYLATRQWVGCSGAYAIQEENDPYLQVVSGSLSNVIGLPLESLSRVFQLISSTSLLSDP